MKLRVRSSTGATTVSVEPAWTLARLKETLGADSLRAGYPPRPVDAPDEKALSALFRDGDVVLVSARSDVAAPSTQPTARQPAASRPVAAPSTQPRPREPSLRGVMVVRVVPDDNSCMFRSVNALLSRPDTDSSVYELRAEVSAVVAAAPQLYSEAFLGRPNPEYCAWILSDNAWGGAIELSILSSRYAVELAAFDLKTMRLDRYGEGNGYGKVGYLVYDGIHYNYICLERRTAVDVTLFDRNDWSTLEKARALAQKEHDGKKYTDTATFALRCGQCNIMLKGEKQAVEHASMTGHTDFQEN